MKGNDAKDAAIVERCRTDIELFAKIFFPHFCRHPFNTFHKSCFNHWAKSARRVRRADAAPRGNAKSTLKSLIKPIHDACYGLEKYIVIFSNTEPQAAQKLKDIRREFLENVRLRYYFGSFFSTKRVPETNFVVSTPAGQCMFSAYGAGTEVRGVRFGAFRPSKIICDDVENSDDVESEMLRQKYENWYKEVVSKLGDEHTNIEFIGTILHDESLLKRLSMNPTYKSEVYKGIISFSTRPDLWDKWTEIYTDLDNTDREEEARAFYEAHKEAMLEGVQVLWPEKEGYYELMIQKIELGDHAFSKEVQNEPLGSSASLFQKFHFYREHKDGLHIEGTDIIVPWRELLCYGAIDPSTGQETPKKGKLGDFTEILTGFHDYKGRLFVHDDFTQRVSPTKYIEQIFERHEKYKYEKFAVETNLYRNLLLPNIERERKDREEKKRLSGSKNYGIRIPFYDVVQVENKIKRIFTLEPKVAHGYILFNRTLSHEFFSQLKGFPKSSHDDAPDCLEILWSLVNGKYKAGALPLNMQR